MTYWAACFVEPRCERKAREGVEELDRGAFLPTFVTTRVSRGRLREIENPILKGYLLVALDSIGDDVWPCIAHLDGVHRVLTNNNKPARVSDQEVARLMLAHAARHYDVNQARSVTGKFERKRRRRRSRPRHGRTARNSTYIIGEHTNGSRYAS